MTKREIRDYAMKLASWAAEGCIISCEVDEDEDSFTIEITDPTYGVKTWQEFNLYQGRQAWSIYHTLCETANFNADEKPEKEAE